MKKLIGLTTMLVMMLVVLTGCVTIDYQVEINEDGSGTISYVYGFDKEFLESMEMSGADMLGEDMGVAEDAGYKVEAYSDRSMEGFKATKEFEDITEFSLEEAFGGDYIEDSDSNRIQFTRTTISQDAELDLTSLEEMAMYGLVFKYTVTLPVEVGDNNADEVSRDGRTLTWNLMAGEITEIQFEAARDGSSGSRSPSNDNEQASDDAETSESTTTEESWLDNLFGGIFGDFALVALILIIVLVVAVFLVIIILIVKKAGSGGTKDKPKAPTKPEFNGFNSNANITGPSKSENDEEEN